MSGLLRVPPLTCAPQSFLLEYENHVPALLEYAAICREEGTVAHPQGTHGC